MGKTTDKRDATPGGGQKGQQETQKKKSVHIRRKKNMLKAEQRMHDVYRTERSAFKKCLFYRFVVVKKKKKRGRIRQSKVHDPSP